MLIFLLAFMWSLLEGGMDLENVHTQTWFLIKELDGCTRLKNLSNESSMPLVLGISFTTQNSLGGIFVLFVWLIQRHTCDLDVSSHCKGAISISHNDCTDI